MIAALHSSRAYGSKRFRKGDIHFGWKTLEDMYRRDINRALETNPRRVPGLKKSYIDRDSWTRLNVAPSKIMQVNYCGAVIN